MAAKTAEIQNNAAAGTRNAQQAAQNQGAGETFGNDSTGLQSGIRKQINGQIASAGTTQESNALENLTSQNYEQGRKNAASTVGGLDALAGLQSPLGYAQTAGSVGGNAFNEADTISKETPTVMSEVGSVLGLGAGLVGDFFTGGLSNLDSAGTSTGKEQAGNFFSGGLSALGGH